MKRYLLLCCIPLLFILTSCEDDTYTIDKVTIDTQINADGTMHVRELFTYTFSGDFNGTTRKIKAKDTNFTAYLANDINNPTDSNENLPELETEEDDDAYKIYTASKDETKKVLYDYDVEESVKKYNDIGTTLYTFFEETNELDLHDVTIHIHSPSNTITDDTYAFLHDENPELLTINGNAIEFHTDTLIKGDNAPIRFIFPASELGDQELTKDKTMKQHIIKGEEDLASRYENLDENMDKITPFVWVLFPVLLILWFLFIRKHPSSKIKKKDQAEVRQLLETMDPLFVKYLSDNEVNFAGNVTNESIIAALFSLKRRGVITIHKVPSEMNDGEETFRFTWTNEPKDVDMADGYLKEWLFTDMDETGPYFLLESIVFHEDESESVQKEKADSFESGVDTWSEHVKSREGYHDLRKVFRPYRMLSIPITILAFGIFYCFTQIETISNTFMWVLPLTMGVLALLSFIFNRNKWILSVFYIAVILATFIWFTLTFTVVLSIIFYSLALFTLLISPSNYWKKDIREMKSVVDQARKMFKKGDYPVSTDPQVNEKQLEYAIVLNAGKQYGEKCEQQGPMNLDIFESYPLLMNPSLAVSTMNVSSLVFYTHSTTSSPGSSSAGGGGGAGAF